MKKILIPTILIVTAINLFAGEFARLKTDAEGGNSNAQANLALLYEEGKETAKNPQKALEWAQKAADQNDPYGQRVLGNLYSNGTVKKDIPKAIEFLTKAAAQDDGSAVITLHSLNRQGEGPAITTPEGLEWNYLWLNVNLELAKIAKIKTGATIAMEAKVKAIKAKLPEETEQKIIATSQKYTEKLQGIKAKPFLK
ncbi:MAG: tetratricopeptide repeat protein [Verrucomicrobiota bacterium]